ncbi:MAG: HEAT repeat domain-containing protein [Candidatus Hydromicrobium sp.]
MDIFGKKPNVEKIRVNKDVEGLIRALKYKDKDVRWEAVEALVKIGKPAVELLIEALKDEDWHVRGRAAVALGNIGDGRAVGPLIKALKDKDSDVRMRAAEALVKIGEPAVELLIEALKDGDWHVRGRAAVALGNIGDGRAVGPLIEALKDGDKDVRWEAAVALGNIGDARAVEPLLRVLDDTHSNAAATALEKIGFNFSDSPPSGVDLMPTRQSEEVIRYVSRQYPELYSTLIDIGISGCEVSYEKMLSMTQSYSNLSYGHVGRDPGVYFKIPNTKCPECKRMVDINCGITVVGHLAPLVKKHIYFELHCPICNESGSNSYSL